MTRKALIGGVAAALLFGSGSLRGATLAGQSVVVDLRAGGYDFGAERVVVGAGDDGEYFGDFSFDLNGGPKGNEFILTSRGDFSGIVGSGNVVWTLGGLYFGPTQTLTGFKILKQDIAPITVNDANGSVVQFQYSDEPIHSGINVIARFLVADSAAPEPATWALLLVGFGLTGVALRRSHTMLPD